eukprot:5188517-Amphidinium_carterae.1
MHDGACDSSWQKFINVDVRVLHQSFQNGHTCKELPQWVCFSSCSKGALIPDKKASAPQEPLQQAADSQTQGQDGWSCSSYCGTITLEVSGIPLTSRLAKGYQVTRQVTVKWHNNLHLPTNPWDLCGLGGTDSPIVLSRDGTSCGFGGNCKE